MKTLFTVLILKEKETKAVYTMSDSVFLIFLITLTLMLIAICCSIYIFKTITQCLNNIVDAATKEASLDKDS